MKRELSVFEKHQKRIALDTLKMSDIGVSIMGGMTKAEAYKFLRSIGYATGPYLTKYKPVVYSKS